MAAGAVVLSIVLAYCVAAVFLISGLRSRTRKRRIARLDELDNEWRHGVEAGYEVGYKACQAELKQSLSPQQDSPNRRQ